MCGPMLKDIGKNAVMGAVPRLIAGKPILDKDLMLGAVGKAVTRRASPAPALPPIVNPISAPPAMKLGG